MSSQTPSSTTTTPPPTRRLYNGSCHCGHTKYQIFLTLPPPIIAAYPPDISATPRLRKCNCTTCHKMSFFHIRLQDSPKDFRLLSPLDPSTELSDYTCFDECVHWYFCPKCGVRCFAFMGEGQRKDLEIGGEIVEVWVPREEGWKEGIDAGGRYLSVNAVTLEAGQEGLDLREWTEKGWITYLDCLKEAGEDRLGMPYEGGMY